MNKSKLHPKSEPSGKDGNDGPADTRPYLCIPYWNAPRFPGDKPDTGEVRSLPSDVVSWECQGIHASPYVPGTQLDVNVDVRNSGPGNATAVATVIVYWADPTVGFSKPNFFGATTIAVPARGGFATTAVLSKTIPASAPEHICLLAVVTHSLDKAGLTVDPVNDRHWAQRNLIAVKASAGFPMTFSFLAANPFTTEEVFELRVQALDRHLLHLMALRMKAEPSELQPRIRLLDERGEAPSDSATDVLATITLRPYGQRRYTLALDLAGELSAQQITAVEAALFLRKDRERSVGSLGIVVVGENIE